MKPSCYIYTAVEALRSAADPEEAARLRRFLAATVGNRDALCDILGITPEEFAGFYPDMSRPDLSTEDTIDTFLSQYSGGAAESQVEAELIIPPSDYALTLEADDDSPCVASSADETSSRIDAFLKAVPAGPSKVVSEPVPSEPAAVEPTATPLTEKLAVMMIRSGNYRKALEILLAIKEKNDTVPYYIDDQIRFLRRISEFADSTQQDS